MNRYTLTTPNGDVLHFSSYQLLNGYILTHAGVGDVRHAPTGYVVTSNLVPIKEIRVCTTGHAPRAVPTLWAAYEHMSDLAFLGPTHGRCAIVVDWADGLTRVASYYKHARDEGFFVPRYDYMMRQLDPPDTHERYDVASDHTREGA